MAGRGGGNQGSVGISEALERHTDVALNDPATLDMEAHGIHHPQFDSKPEEDREKPGWRKLVANIGPGFLVCMAYIDPGSMQTLFQIASNDKYQLLWIILLGFILVFIVQSLAAKLGVATGMHLAEHFRLEYPQYLGYCLWVLAQIGVVGADIAEVIGTAFALNILLHFPVWVGVLLTGLTPFILSAIQRFGFRKLEMMLAMVVFVIAACFIGELPYAKPKSSEVLHGFIPSFGGHSAIGDSIAFLGALIMPHNLFIHSAVVLTRKPPQSAKGITDACRYFVIESAPPLILVLFINVVAVSVAGSICFNPNVSSKSALLCEDLTVNNAAFLFRNVLGKWCKLVYGISLLASSQGSALTVGCTGQFVVQGFLQKKVKKWIITTLTRMVAIVPSLVVALIGGSSACARLLIISSLLTTAGIGIRTVGINHIPTVYKRLTLKSIGGTMVLSFELPFTILPLLRFTSSRKKMGPHTNHILVIIVAWILGLCVIAINVYFLSTGFVTWLLHNNLPKAVSVITGMIVFPIMAIYLIALLYLAFKKVHAVTYKPPPTSPPATRSNTISQNDQEEELEEIPYRDDLAEMAI